MKGAITITSEELAKMKMKANLLPNRIKYITKLIPKTIIQSINYRKAKNVLTNGQTTQNILNKENKSNDSKSLKNNSCNVAVSTKNKENFSKG